MAISIREVLRAQPWAADDAHIKGTPESGLYIVAKNEVLYFSTWTALVFTQYGVALSTSKYDF